MRFQAPHWLTVVIACTGVCAGALVSVFPEYATLLGMIAAGCAALAAPTVKPSPTLPAPAPLPKDVQ